MDHTLALIMKSQQGDKEARDTAVSYTHLTLPTKLEV